MKGTMLDEQKRLKELMGAKFREKETGLEYRVVDVYHNIYKDVCLKIVRPDGKSRELIEGSEDYHKKFERIDGCLPQ